MYGKEENEFPPEGEDIKPKISHFWVVPFPVGLKRDVSLRENLKNHF